MVIIISDKKMNNVDITMNFASGVNLIAVLLLMRAVIKDRNKLKGYSVIGAFLPFIAIFGFEIGFIFIGNYLGFGLGIINLVFWFMAFVFSFRNFINKKKE
jgi:hypothetical protein